MITQSDLDAGWRDIESAPKRIEFRDDGQEYGPHILAYPINGEVGRVRWWQASRDPKRICNFLGDCGNAYFPTAWMPLPPPPGEAQ